MEREVCMMGAMWHATWDSHRGVLAAEQPVMFGRPRAAYVEGRGKAFGK